MLTLLCDQLGDVQQVAEQRLVLLCGIAEPGQAVANLGDHEEVHRGLGVDVAKGQGLVILKDDCAGNPGMVVGKGIRCRW